MEKKIWSNAEVVELGVESTRDDSELMSEGEEKKKHGQYCDGNHKGWEACNNNNLIGDMLPGQGVDTIVPTFS